MFTQRKNFSVEDNEINRMMLSAILRRNMRCWKRRTDRLLLRF